jgi:hypothetical protein
MTRMRLSSARAARTQADESRAAATAALSTPTKAVRSNSIKELYKTAAKRLHPDLARDDADWRIRDRLMADVNLAYEQGDEAKLLEILEEYDSSPDTVVGSDVAAELVRAIRRISLVRKRIQQIESDITELRDSELFKLKSLVAEQAKLGKDVLSDIVASLKAQIDAKKDHLRSL